jgi:hypothetical protein
MRTAAIVLAVPAMLVLMSTYLVVTVARQTGLFHSLGVDYGVFGTQAIAWLTYGPAAAYDLDRLLQVVAWVTPYYDVSTLGPVVDPSPYPVLFFLLYAPFTLLPPPLGFALWTLGNLVLAWQVANGLSARFRGGRLERWARAVAFVAFFPIFYALFVGPATVVLLFAFYRAYLDLERGRDYRAGLWAGVFALKAQYLLALGLVLLYKRRWRAIAGIASTAAAIWLVSLALMGPDAVRGLLASVREHALFRPELIGVGPQDMISWRGLLWRWAPALSNADGTRLTWLLSAASIVPLIAIWHGRWDPRSAAFASRMLATMIVTMLIGFHNHLHGAALLLVPGAILAAQGHAPRPVLSVLRVGLLLPTVAVFLTHLLVRGLTFGLFPHAAVDAFVLLMLIALSALVVDEVRRWAASRRRPLRAPLDGPLAPVYLATTPSGDGG